jgi:DHA1 family tetracycline resistance protein-like MFS transporter
VTAIPPAGPHVDPRARRVLIIVFCTVFLDLAGFGIIIPLLPLYVKSMGGTAETVGILLSSFSLTQLVATPILGRLSDRAGRRRVILTSLAGNAASMMLFAAATHLRLLPLLFVSRILAGATAGNLAACQAAVADVTHGELRAKGMGLIGAGIGLGLVLGPVVGGWASRLGPSAPPLVAAALACVDLVAALFLMPETRVVSAEPRPEVNGPPQPTLGAVMTQPRILVILALYFLTFLYMTTLQVALPLLANARLAWTAEEVGHVFGLFGLIGLVVQGVLIGRLTRIFGEPNLVVFGAIASMAGLLTIAAAHRAPILVVGLTLLGFGLGVTNPILSTLASNFAGSSRQGVVLGFAQSAGGLARTLGPVGSGILYARVGPGSPFVGGASAALLALALALGIRIRSGRGEESA